MFFDEQGNKKYRAILIILVAILLVLVGFFITQINELQGVTKLLHSINVITGNTQRLVKLGIANEPSRDLILYVDKIVYELQINQKNEKQFNIAKSQLAKYSQQLKKTVENWESLKVEIEYSRQVGWQGTKILLVSERYFYNSEALSLDVIDYSETLSNIIKNTQTAIIGVMTLILLVIIREVVLSVKVLRNSHEISKHALIDLHTGLYNKSGCEKLFKTTSLDLYKKKSAILIFDLNNLKSINDTLGHACGDEMISTFAQIVKQATELYVKESFVGRYGGDEFIVFYFTTTKQEILEYLENVQMLTARANEQKLEYKISYAVGYALSKSYKEDLSIKELLEYADVAMYKNKKFIKSQDPSCHK